MLEVCDRYSVPVIDLYAQSGISPFLPEHRELYMPTVCITVLPAMSAWRIASPRVSPPFAAKSLPFARNIGLTFTLYSSFALH